ncbi:putative methyltransferase-domain-containing protein [Glomus cerebriforme]|uniref:Putative methyltransferase-domain-containing protein n=1 Tax=Glomus cerebriforme TaxID=658196 RepID=A0A397SIP0_9GLOM|nr:putative methyltransferase-domain-containing protein [Glomus cerebriforme]
MSPSQANKIYPFHRKDFPKPPSDFEELNSAYAAGDYTTAVKILDFLLTNITDQVSNSKRCEAREHVLLARAVCFQQMREHQQVISDTNEVVKVTLINVTSTSNVSIKANDHIFCHILALWLRSLAFESLENWERAKNDLGALKTLILEKNNNMITFKTEGALSVFLPHMTPLIAQYKVNSIMFNLHCVNDRQRRMNSLVVKDAARRNDSSLAFRLIDEDIENCNDLAKKFHYRLLLRRPLHPNIHVNMWYTLDLMFVSEMGLFKREDLIGVQGYKLGCRLVEINVDKEIPGEYEVQVRPMSAESREWSDCADTDWAGVQNGGKGGLEFRVVRTSKQGRNGLSISDSSSCESNGFITSNGCNGSNGFLKSSEILNENASGHRRKNSNSNQQLYLYVYPIQAIINENYDHRNENSDFFSGNDINGSVKNKNIVNSSNDDKEYNRYVQENHLVPLAIGPIRIVSCKIYSTSCVHHLPPNGSNCPILTENNIVAIQSKPSCDSKEVTNNSLTPRRKSPWSIDDCLVDNYRGFILPNGKYLMIKELWDAGIPGKVWDSAFIIVQMIKDNILKNGNLFVGKRILDMSTGTGFVGLYLAAFLSSLSEKKINNSKTNLILTDLDYALKLIRENLELNKFLLNSNSNVTIDVEALKWGDVSKAKKLGVFDYVLASDVVYEPDLFDDLIQTLMAVCTPGKTKIYLGYKRRGLNKDEEARFFDKLQNKFHKSAVQGLGNLAEEGKVNVYELSRK